MKLAHPNLTEPIRWAKGPVQTLVVESPVLFRSMALDLLGQMEYQKGQFVLSLDDCPVDLSKYAEIITDVYRLNPAENKRIINAMQKEAATTAVNEMPDKLAVFYSQLSELMSDLVFRTNQDAIYDEISEPAGLLKLCNWRPDTNDLSLAERLVLYMDLCQKYLKKDVFILFQVAACLTDKERTSLCRDAAYRGWKLLLLESHLEQKAENESVIILDRDWCELS